MMTGKVFLFCTLGLLAASMARGGQVTIPNTFQAGQKALAGEVNDNFTAVQGEVNDNDTRIQVNAAGIASNAGDIANLQGHSHAAPLREFGRTVADGNIDLSPQPPDLSTCDTGTCEIGLSSYPGGDWMYLGRYTLPAVHGTLDIMVEGPIAVVRDTVPAGSDFELTFTIGEAFNFPSPGSEFDIGTTVLTVPAGISGWYPMGNSGGRPVYFQRIQTAMLGLTPGTAYAFYVRASQYTHGGGDAVFVETPVSITFTETASVVDITPN